MSRNTYEQAGQQKLTILLALNLVITAVSPLILQGVRPTSPAYYGLLLLPLLPPAVVLWGIWRGSFPALALFVVLTVTQLGDMVGLLQFGGVEILDRSTALGLIILLLRLTTVLAVFRHDEIAHYWSARRYAHTKRDLILEIVLLVISVLVGYLPFLLLF